VDTADTKVKDASRKEESSYFLHCSSSSLSFLTLMLYIFSRLLSHVHSFTQTHEEHNGKVMYTKSTKDAALFLLLWVNKTLTKTPLFSCLFLVCSNMDGLCMLIDETTNVQLAVWVWRESLRFQAFTQPFCQQRLQPVLQTGGACHGRTDGSHCRVQCDRRQFYVLCLRSW
jgi:hypothetical protein